MSCGKTGIRTLGTVARTTVFETVPIDHSGIFPCVVCECKFSEKNLIIVWFIAVFLKKTFVPLFLYALCVRL